MALESIDWSALIREFRQAHGLKQEAAAEFLGVSQASISRWESGAGLPTVAMRNRLYKEMRRMVAPAETVLWASTFRRLPTPGAVVGENRVAQVVTNFLAKTLGADRAELEGLPIDDLFEGEILELASLMRESGGFAGEVVSAEGCAELRINRQIRPDTSFYIHLLNWPHFVDGGYIVRVNQGAFVEKGDAKQIRERLGGAFRFDRL